VKRPSLEVADIIRAAGRSFIDQQRFRLNRLHCKVLRAIERCRTAALGGHRDRCTRCGYTAAISYNSCLMGSLSLWGVEQQKGLLHMASALSTLH
jgi:Transposase zinc-binding domain